MQTFTIGFGRSWWIRAFGRNALVRPSDRIEAWAYIVAVLVVVLGTPVAGAIGTSVHDVRSSLYATQAQTRQQVTATATEAGRLDVQPYEVSYTVRATWTAGGREHVEVIEWPGQAKIGDQQRIWVTDGGEHARPPRDRSGAVGDAVVVALSVWLGVAATATGFVCGVRRLLDRRRYADWEREAYADDGGRKHHK